MGEQALPMISAADDRGVGVTPVEHVVECKPWPGAPLKHAFRLSGIPRLPVSITDLLGVLGVSAVKTPSASTFPLT